MADIRHRVGSGATAEETYASVSTRQGLTSWWTQDVRGDDSLGGRLEFYFGQEKPGAVMEVTELVENKRVGWRCVEGPDEWVGTEIAFELSPAGSRNGPGAGTGTAIMFTHAGWREPIPFMHHCSTKWALFLLGLQARLDGGEATPYPHDRAISDWR